MIKIKIFFFLCISAILCSCHDSLVKQADKLYDEKRYSQALLYYERFLSLNKKTELSAHAAYRVATIYSFYINDCKKASYYFEFIVKNFPQSKYFQESKFRAIFCPNYFYPAYKRFIIGDSKSYGKNAKEIIEIKKKTYQKVELVSKIYAGKRLISSSQISYIVDGNNVFKKDSNSKEIFLSYPLINKDFESNGFEISYHYPQTVQVKAKRFENCLLIKKKVKNQDTAQGYYYAPEIGKILVTSFYKDTETRIMELISYE